MAVPSGSRVLVTIPAPMEHQGKIAEWGRHTLEVLRQPLESGVVTVSRALRQSDFPARFQLVAATQQIGTSL